MDIFFGKKWARELYTVANWWFLCFVLGGMLMNNRSVCVVGCLLWVGPSNTRDNCGGDHWVDS